MIYLVILGMVIAAVLMVHKVGTLTRYIKEQDNTNLMHAFKCPLGWAVGFLYLSVLVLLVFIFEKEGYLLQLIDIIISLIIIAVIDIKWRIIPNFLTINVLLSQLVFTYLISSVYLSIWNIVITIVILLLFMLVSKISKEQIGMGDVKLIATIGLIYGLSFTVYTLIMSMILMLLITLPMLFMKKIKLKTEMPFAPFYAIGTSVYIILNLI